MKKACKDCRHFSYSRWHGAECHAHPLKVWSNVWGWHEEYRVPGNARLNISYCGPDGVWFEPKRSLWQKLTTAFREDDSDG